MNVLLGNYPFMRDTILLAPTNYPMTQQEPTLLLGYKSDSVSFVKMEPDVTCNGKVHRQERYCQRPAGWGTDHKGSGRCKLHGGCSTGPKTGQLRYSDYVPENLVELYEVFSSETDKDIKSLNDEIAMLRARIAVLASKNIDIKDEKGKITDFEGRYDGTIVGYVEALRRLIESKQKIEEGIKSHITVDVVVRAVQSFIQIVDKTVSDIATKKRIAGELRRLNMDELGLEHLN